MSSYSEERRKDRAAERAEDRADRAAAAELRDKRRAEAEERARKAQAADRREADRRREQQREAAARRRAEARARYTATLKRATAEGDTIAALVVMACSIAPAFYFQVSALTAVPGLPGFIAVCLAVMLEAGAWVATIAGERAKREGRPVGKFRAAMWACAALAAWINYGHAPASPGNWLAYVLAAASLGGVFFWELRGAGRHGGKAGRTRADRREAAARRRHALARRFRFRAVHKRYRMILTAMPYGTVDREQAWERAWVDHHGAPLADTADALDHRTRATEAYETGLADGGRPFGIEPRPITDVDAFLAGLFPDADDAAADGPQSGPQGGGGTGVRTRHAEPAEGETPLGRKGMQGSSDPSSKAPVRSLDPSHLDAVRRLADELGGADRLSIAKIRRAGVGGNDRYLSALRNKIQGEGRK
ncbi:DUF2637 domain-containing protein [Streptomyces sp. CAI-85]|uniref:DUF2637 domain-containing protein n=1 Tax=Streptomyces sp. CAI-85 TaxID=1472662 RepID=UPI001587E404|nr:DUF2637 domain-containing protein [Streptomyces sp. CAI-85]NUV64289.1 DUF2637 domain-containing protein [Streptomyces sp. CAI-85]